MKIKKPSLNNYELNKGTVGVYVNATFEDILSDYIPLQFDVVQLHGDEDSAFAKALLELDIKVFKAFQMNEDFDFDSLKIGNSWPKNFQENCFSYLTRQPKIMVAAVKNLTGNCSTIIQKIFHFY